ncbi:MAG: archaetidylserine decarboxylase [gamma proteobacterium symbiont of Taylorina sp.]|nr:archaetidylserine decarboxylase [gamma proteobacterium symbiont of Taylorina sp.]
MTSSNTQINTKENASLLDYLKTWPLFLLPQHFLSSLIHWFMRIKQPWFKNQQISQFIKLFNVNMNEAQQQSINGFTDFNHFFTRKLKNEVRIDQTNDKEICCPVDGAISEIGLIDKEQLIQAKGHYFNLSNLLADNESLTETFIDGSFATIYLSPRDYHRIHMPINGILKEMHHVPGNLFGVNRASVKTIPNLFARNERVISIFDTPAGKMALIQVGAIFVSSIETIWQGVITPPRQKSVQNWKYQDDIKLAKAQEMGRFNMGSTVVLLFSKDMIEWSHELTPNTPVQMGQLLGKISIQ